MADTRGITRRAISILIIAATLLGLYNVYGDNSEVVKLAEQAACGEHKCAVTMTRQDRNPFTQSFTFQTDIEKQTTVDVRCARSLYLLGGYSCERK
jgi:hypothetical protein